MQSAQLKIILRASGIMLTLGLGVYYYFQYQEKYPSTDDAYVNANLVNIAPKVNGYVTQVLVKNNQVVQQGQVLFRIETKDYSVQYAQEQQALNYALQQAKTAQTQVDSAQAALISAQASYKNLAEQVQRYTQMNKQNAASTEQLQNYQMQFTQAKSQVEQAHNSLLAAKNQVQATKAQVAQAQAGVDDAKNHIGYTDVIAPVNGYVTNMYLAQGQYVTTGQAVFGLVANENWWVDANFKENDLARIKIGQPVQVDLDMYDHIKYRGIVQSISYASGNTFSLLPAQNATGNWVKVTQRFTVRIKIADNAQYPLRVGASADVKVDTTQK
jgi:membrane fusion protein (multidrug efflux system)